ncbi:biotin--[acetyl-CoA-carboxylase] ligase [Alkalilimnicola sp. S0819]|uniref:biotin--[acetyl-CoA-carboxylase] ligase n=1 Tax=Alkalilimnicola sp. S0819 TaxID=2613922 RepID=UPI001261988E|nr:biotin--[acetyl-CoA-carboxylase] ligase [Alkalilimnicola sp. S0819]KAB7622838.1 biotin--[acetyl-CoA-carboxylase] ligase [Alkalilimnicola sp. S0819]MPQ17160.1 biotin--[acetyl-CoA-carboxylase] ligase [Alkalilimnicola sp. S0819]
MQTALAEPAPSLNAPAYRVWKVLADGTFRSGEDLARAEGVSRAAIGKAVNRLRALGVGVQAVTGRGYRLEEPVELLDARWLERALAVQSRSQDFALRVVPSADSTNAVLMSAARSGAADQALFAEWQTLGRGRRGRGWIAPPGRSLCFSILLQMPVLPCSVAALSLAVGVAVVERLETLGIIGLALKWPNDLLAPEGKLGGILLEMVGEPEGPCTVVVGIGLNLALTAAERDVIQQPASDLRSLTGRLPGRNRLAAELVSAVRQSAELYKQAGFAPFRERWSGYDAYAGREVVLHLPTGTVSGVAQGIDEQGSLRLKTTQGLRLFGSGEVSLRGSKP